ncbi:SUMF1/EgtB/PvdO family nonheme iron enzyme [Nonomuraea sp. B1E8]|uniref:SUMF1/EgtB/PvdO family nonheme iron enzyme n=1 Tax=unclassified Nonomuraea TaxID=2593643 RepID=UPI00325CF5A9
MATVDKWTGREIRALREAKRMSIRDFAEHIGISDRMVSKWEAGGETIVPRQMNQAALDTVLVRSDPEVHERFERILNVVPLDSPATAQQQGVENPGSASSPKTAEVRHPGDGRLMALVEAGIFLSGPKDEPVWLPDFYIDVYPVTNADYARFVEATSYEPPRHWTAGTRPTEDLDHPVVFVNWHDAAAYAEWAQKDLPTSQQWEKAARGPRGDIYPWGSQETPAKCNSRESGLRHTTPVDTYHSGVSMYGVYDMCGNTWEWCSTRSQEDPVRYELKGSAFTSPFFRATPSKFNDASPLMMDDDTGFRCAISAEELRAQLER